MNFRGDYGPSLRLTKDGKVQKAEKKPKMDWAKFNVKKI